MFQREFYARTNKLHQPVSPMDIKRVVGYSFSFESIISVTGSSFTTSKLTGLDQLTQISHKPV
jgi:hypothetical protein